MLGVSNKGNKNLLKEFGKLVGSCTNEGNNRTKRNIEFMNFRKSIYS